MFGFSKHCPVCGMDVKTESSIQKFGKHFCSDNCAEKYSVKEKQDKPDSGGCC